MAIVLNSTPADYSSAHGDLIFTAYEATKAIDPITYPGYKYLCDVYIGGTMIYRARTSPNPVNNRGIFNIGPIVRNYLAMSFNPASGIHSQEFGAGVFSIAVQCKFGEEYAFTTYTNVTVDSSRTYFNHYNNQILNLTTILDGYLDLAASNRPYENTVFLTASKLFVPYLASTTTAFPVEIKTYDDTNTLIDTQSTTYTPSAAFTLHQLNLSPVAINSIFAALIDSTTSYYTVKIGATSTYKFTLTCEKIYTRYTLHFLNQLGGFDSYDFKKVSRKTYDIEKKSYAQLPYRVASDGTVNYSNSGGVVNSTATTYSSLFKQKMKLTSDLLNDKGYEWLKELQFSPIVYFEYGNFLIPVTVEGTNYEAKKFVNDKMSALVVDVNFGQSLNAQFQ